MEINKKSEKEIKLTTAQPIILDSVSDDIAFIRSAAVSYTHLDVYKRQLLYIGGDEVQNIRQ